MQLLHTLAFTLALLLLSAPVRAQEVANGTLLLRTHVAAAELQILPGGANPAPVSVVVAADFGRNEGYLPVAPAASSLGHSAGKGALIGGVAGVAFALLAISFANCSGPDCTQEKVVGVVGYGLSGAAVGAGIGALVHLIRR